MDRDGAVLGMITRTGSAIGRAIWWSDLVARLEELGFPVNLQPRLGVRGRSGFARIAGDVTQRPGRDLDGTRFRGGGRIEIGGVLVGLHEIVTGFDRIVIKGDEQHIAPERGAQPDVFILHYLFYGYRYRTKPPLIRFRQPHSVSVGMDLMGPVGAWGVTAVTGDSIDVRTGEPVNISRSVRFKNGVAVTLRGDFRAYLSEHTGIIVEYALLHPGLQSLGVPVRFNRVSIGVDYRWSF